MPQISSFVRRDGPRGAPRSGKALYVRSSWGLSFQWRGLRHRRVMYWWGLGKHHRSVRSQFRRHQLEACRRFSSQPHDRVAATAARSVWYYERVILFPGD